MHFGNLVVDSDAHKHTTVHMLWQKLKSVRVWEPRWVASSGTALFKGNSLWWKAQWDDDKMVKS